VETYVGAK
jgi:hypothetical protein